MEADLPQEPGPSRFSCSCCSVESDLFGNLKYSPHLLSGYLLSRYLEYSTSLIWISQILHIFYPDISYLDISNTPYLLSGYPYITFQTFSPICYISAAATRTRLRLLLLLLGSIRRAPAATARLRSPLVRLLLNAMFIPVSVLLLLLHTHHVQSAAAAVSIRCYTQVRFCFCCC